MTASNPPASDETSTCPWCSAAVPAEASRCPSCGAALRDGVDDEVPGVTQVDLKATSRLARLKPPGRVAMWLGAERTTDDLSLSGRIEPPSDEVRKEMLRLELAAIDAEIEVKTTLAEAQRSLPPEEGGPDVPAEPAQALDAGAAGDAAEAVDAAEAGDAPDGVSAHAGDTPDGVSAHAGDTSDAGDTPDNQRD